MAEGDAAADEALAAADALGLDSAWSDTAVSQVRARPDADPATVRRRLDEALRAGPPVRRRRRRDAGAVQPGHRRVRGRPDRRRRSTWTRRATRRARDLGIEWSFYPAELRHLQVTALYMAGRLGREPGRGRPAGPGARDGRARARRRAAGAGRPRRSGRAGAAGLGAGADPAAARARAARPGHGRLGDRPRRLGRRRRRPPSRSRWRPAGGCSGSGRTTTSASCGWSATALGAGGRRRRRGAAGR